MRLSYPRKYREVEDELGHTHEITPSPDGLHGTGARGIPISL
jgi:hypothetical protein